MKRQILKALAAAFLTIVPSLALAQEPARIAFSKGSGTQTLKGTDDKSTSCALART